MDKITLENADQYQWGNAGKGWLLSLSKDRTVAERELSPGVKEVRHYHKEAWQFFYILSGTGTMWVDGETVELSKNEAFEVDPQRHHQLSNTGEEQMRYLVFSTPNSYDDRIEVDE